MRLEHHRLSLHRHRRQRHQRLGYRHYYCRRHRRQQQYRRYCLPPPRRRWRYPPSPLRQQLVSLTNPSPRSIRQHQETRPAAHQRDLQQEHRRYRYRRRPWRTLRQRR